MNLHIILAIFWLGGGLLSATAQTIFGTTPVHPIPAPLAEFVHQQVLPRDAWTMRLGMTEEELRKVRPNLSKESDRGLYGRVVEERFSESHLFASASYSFGKKSLTTFNLNSAVKPYTSKQVISAVEWLRAAFGDPAEAFLMNLRPKTPEMEGIAFVWQLPEMSIGFSCHITPGYPDSILRVFPKGKKASSMFNTSDATHFNGSEAVTKTTQWAEAMIR
jgi:hypothetical protein